MDSQLTKGVRSCVFIDSSLVLQHQVAKCCCKLVWNRMGCIKIRTFKRKVWKRRHHKDYGCGSSDKIRKKIYDWGFVFKSGKEIRDRLRRPIH